MVVAVVAVMGVMLGVVVVLSGCNDIAFAHRGDDGDGRGCGMGNCDAGSNVVW